LPTTASQNEPITVCLLVSREETRAYVYDLLNRNGHRPVTLANFDELWEEVKVKGDVMVFLDGDAIIVFGTGMVPKIKAANPCARIILLYDSYQKDLVKQAMDFGAHGCILEPYADWEILAMVRHIRLDTQPHRSKTSRKAGKPAAGRIDRRKE
jgi:DNA-binding NtrC family response regulator